MAFAVQITQATPAEYPLMQTLRDTVFSEWGHVSRTSISEALRERQDVLALLAHLEGNPVGFCVGYRRSPGLFYVNYLGVLSDYRGGGLGRQMMLQQENFARANKYRQIQFNTFNHFRHMLRLAISLDYRPIGIEQHDGTGNDIAIRFGKFLSNDSPTQPFEPYAEQKTSHISCDDRAELRRSFDAGRSVVGMIRDVNGRLFLQMATD
jgi:GNAT superfamily N-acetyltransferase